MNTTPERYLTDFEVAIPNPERTKIVERLTIQVPVERIPQPEKKSSLLKRWI